MGIYLYDCVGRALASYGAAMLSPRPVEKSLVAPSPRAGLWKVVVDASAADAAFDYTEIVTNPRFGSGAAAGDNVSRRIGARWNQKVSYQVTGAAPFGYQLVGVMDVIDADSETDERAAPRLATQIVPLAARR